MVGSKKLFKVHKNKDLNNKLKILNQFNHNFMIYFHNLQSIMVINIFYNYLQ